VCLWCLFQTHQDEDPTNEDRDLCKNTPERRKKIRRGRGGLRLGFRVWKNMRGVKKDPVRKPGSQGGCKKAD